MDMDRLFLIEKMPNLSLEFSRLVSMMNYARFTTLKDVSDLCVEELDFLPYNHSNSIGMLLLHMAAVEVAYQVHTIENRDLSVDELTIWEPALQLGELGREKIKNYPIEFYLEKLHTVRQYSLQRFQTLPDEWLYTTTPFWYDKPANNYFKWFHVFEDEISHRGQIRIIKNYYKSRLNKEKIDSI